MTKTITPRLSGRRTLNRHGATPPAGLLASTDLAGPMLLDISCHGCRVTGFAGAANVGAPISVRPAGLPAMTAWVRWAVGSEVGLEFARPLPAMVVDQLAAAHAVSVDFNTLAS